MRKIYLKLVQRIINRQWDETALHSLYLASLVFVFFLFASSFLFIGNKVSREKFEIYTVKIPSALERKINKLVGDKPIRAMAPFIAEKNKQVAAYLVAIAKKESSWGKYSPKKFGKECYNYWGYRGEQNPTASGYSCFDNPKQAVDVVGERIEELIGERIDTPGEMVVWKCGDDCASHNSSSVIKWISDVDLYYKKINGT